MKNSGRKKNLAFFLMLTLVLTTCLQSGLYSMPVNAGEDLQTAADSEMSGSLQSEVAEEASEAEESQTVSSEADNGLTGTDAGNDDQSEENQAGDQNEEQTIENTSSENQDAEETDQESNISSDKMTESENNAELDNQVSQADDSIDGTSQTDDFGDGTEEIIVTDEETSQTAVEGSKDFTYENESYSFKIHLEGSAKLSSASDSNEDQEAELQQNPDENVDVTQSEPSEQMNDAEEAASVETALDWSGMAMETKEIAEDSDAYDQLALFAENENQEEQAQLFDLVAMQFEFCQDGIPVDVTGCTITAEITPRQSIFSEAEQKLEEEAAIRAAADNGLFSDDSEADAAGTGEDAENADQGVVLLAMQMNDENISRLEETVISKDTEENAVLTVTFAAADTIAVAASNGANPSFKVQYYAYVDQLASSGNASLNVIDTDGGGDGNGGNLPQNGTTPNIKKLYLNGSDSSTYTVATNKNKVVEVYKQKSYEYVKAPGLYYVNSLSHNGNYTLKEVWVLKEGKDSSSTNKKDWTVYTDIANLHFTNNQSSADSNKIAISDNMTIRLVYGTTEGSYNNTAAFYDYDISDGKYYKTASTSGKTYTTQEKAGNKTVYAYTYQQGINSDSNYSGSGSKLAFGNSNTGSGRESETWNGSTLNQYNRTGSGYNGCTFGLVSGLDASGNIVYSSGVSAPNLFNDGAAIGKTSVGDYTLDFTRDGDTYTLSSVEGTVAQNLDKFTHMTTFYNSTGTYSGSIYSNFFWPMDSANTWGAKGHDLKFGANNVKKQRQHFGYGNTTTFPVSDEDYYEDKDHNSYFGMQYSVKFNLTKDYVGPLEYYFFGDDDMWVFLDGNLVCDIGGVHSSVGEYVNLWDYLKKGDSSAAGTHTLSFFYTERGASGSTCYMRFTLPSVSNVVPAQTVGGLKLEKKVDGTQTDADKEFCFDVSLKDQSRNSLSDDYSYTRYSSSGSEISSDLISGSGTVNLKNGEYIIISNLPSGTMYTINETEGSDGQSSLSNYEVTFEQNGESTKDSVSGSVSAGNTVSVVCKNKERTASVKIPVTKTLNNADGKEHTYTFKLEQINSLSDKTAVQNGTAQELQITISGSALSPQSNSFTLDYNAVNLETSPQSLYYKITEEIPSSGNTAGYDRSVWLAEVVVTKKDSQNGDKMTAVLKKLYKENADGSAGSEASANPAAAAAFVNKLIDETILPSTGGMGTYLFTIGGTALVTAAVLLFARTRRKGDGKRRKR